MTTHHLRPGSAALLMLALAGTAVLGDDGPAHRLTSQFYGVSGGNANDIGRAFCCSGTLGALVSLDGASYILSNNHVLARSGQAPIGDDVSQPGLIDNGCAVAEVVGDLSAFAPLGTSNVDAAIAALRPGAMDASGFILDIGVPSSTTAAPVVGMDVAKSGRTTGLTTGTVAAIDLDVRIQYQQGCRTGRRFFVNYTNQILIDTPGFSAGGDSGSLIMTDDGAHNPVGLLFAGSRNTTIANPIDDVLGALGTALSATVSFNVPGATAIPPDVRSALNGAELARGRRAKNAHAARLMSGAGVVAVGVGEDPANPGAAAVLVYVERGTARAAIARQFNGVPTRIIETDPIVAYGWNEKPGTSCSPR